MAVQGVSQGAASAALYRANAPAQNEPPRDPANQTSQTQGSKRPNTDTVTISNDGRAALKAAQEEGSESSTQRVQEARQGERQAEAQRTNRTNPNVAQLGS